MPTLIKWSDNWADEMDVEGFIIINNEEDLKLFRSNLQKTQRIIISLGTNEEIIYSSVKHLADKIQMYIISDEEFKVIDHLLGNGYGFTNFYRQVLEL